MMQAIAEASYDRSLYIIETHDHEFNSAHSVENNLYDNMMYLIGGDVH